jgi:hypothetical protein
MLSILYTRFPLTWKTGNQANGPDHVFFLFLVRHSLAQELPSLAESHPNQIQMSMQPAILKV